MLNHGLALFTLLCHSQANNRKGEAAHLHRIKKTWGLNSKATSQLCSCFPMSLSLRPFHCFSFSHCQTPLGKEMSAHKLSYLAQLEEKTPYKVTFYKGHNPMYWASHTDSKFPLYICSPLVLCLMHFAERSLPTAWSSMPVLAGPGTSQPDTSDAWLHREIMTWWMPHNYVLNLVLLEVIFLWLVSRLFPMSYNLPICHIT